MSDRTERPIVVVEGTMCTIEYAVAFDGSTPAREFIEGLDESDQRKLDTLFHRMAGEGKIYNPQKFKHEGGAIFAFKSFQIRIGCFRRGKSWVLTHGFKKKKDRWPAAELTKANRIMDEHIAGE